MTPTPRAFPRFIETIPRQRYRFIALLTTSTPLVPSSQPPPGPRPPTPSIVGREAELEWLHTALAKAQAEEGIVQLRQGLSAHQATGAALGWTLFLLMLAEAYHQSGQAREGLAMLAEAQALVDSKGERVYEAELYRLRRVDAAKGSSSKFKVQSHRPQTPTRRRKGIFSRLSR